MPLVNDAVSAFNAGRPARALALLDAELARFPRRRGLLLLRAHALRALGRREEAAAGLARAARLAPRDASVQLSLAALLHELGRDGEALERFWRAAALDAKAWSGPEKAAILGRVLLGASPARARSLLSALACVLRRRPAVEGSLLRLRLELALGREIDARALARGLKPRDLPVLAAALAEAERAARGLLLDEARRALDRDAPDEALRSCARARAAGPSLEELEVRAEAFLLAGLRSRALAAAAEARRLRGAAAQSWAAGLYSRLGRFDLALFVLARPLSKEAASQRARLELWSGRPGPAARWARRAGERAVLGGAEVLSGRPAAALRLLKKERDEEALIWRGEALRLLGRPAEALRLLRGTEASLGARVNVLLCELDLGRKPAAALLRAIDDSAPWRQLGLGLLPWPSRRRAEALLAALRGNRGRRPTFRWKGSSRLRQWTRAETLHLQSGLRFGAVEETLREFKRLIAEDPAAAYSWASHGEVCLWLGRAGPARRSLRRALRLDPSLPWPRIGLAAAALLEGRLGEARRLIEDAGAAGAAPRYTAAWRGALLLKEGRPKEALSAFAEAGARPPFRLGMWPDAALARAAAGDRAGARRILASLRRHAPALMKEAGTLKRASAMTRGNRSSWFYTFVDRSGRLRHVPLAGLKPSAAPAALARNSWAFETYAKVGP